MNIFFYLYLFYFCHYLLTLMLFQTCMTSFLIWNMKEGILKNVEGGEMYNYISAMHHKCCEAADSLAIAFPHTFAISSWLSIFLSVFHTVIGLASAYKL